VIVTVGAFRAHGQDAFNRWAGWAAVAAVPLAAFTIVLASLDRRERRVGRDRAWREQVCRLLVQGSPLGLPRLSEVPDDQLGATPTRYSIDGRAPYMARPDADGEIRRLLALPGPPYPFVVVWGTIKAGKSRTPAEALRASFADDPVVVLPVDALSLCEAARLGVDQLEGRRRAVVVLDDLDAAGLESLTAEVLTAVRGWAVIAATMTAERRAEVLSTSGGRRGDCACSACGGVRRVRAGRRGTGRGRAERS
jgi:hypothetical protein